jgi:hypothetical protein
MENSLKYFAELRDPQVERLQVIVELALGDGTSFGQAGVALYVDVGLSLAVPAARMQKGGTFFTYPRQE